MEDVEKPDPVRGPPRHRVGPHQRLPPSRRRSRGEAQARLRRLRVSQDQDQGKQTLFTRDLNKFTRKLKVLRPSLNLAYDKQPCILVT